MRTIGWAAINTYALGFCSLMKNGSSIRFQCIDENTIYMFSETATFMKGILKLSIYEVLVQLFKKQIYE